MFTYDALGRRIAKTVVVTPASGPVVMTTRTYVYDGEDIVWEEETTDASGTPVTTTSRYIHGPGIDEPLLIETGGQVLAVHADGLGSVTGLSDASQTLVEQRSYTAFGRMQRTGSWPDLAHAYTGREWEPELGLSYYRARYHDPDAGRFLSRDPIGLAAGDTNLYAYVANNAANYGDPTGLYTGQYPPPPPGYDPTTWKYGRYDNGRYWVRSPSGKFWVAHPEDEGHWRHWDVKDSDSKKQTRWPDNSRKPWPNQRRPTEPGQSATDPNGSAPEWNPPEGAWFYDESGQVPLPSAPPLFIWPVPPTVPIPMPAPAPLGVPALVCP
jgi:RHS repeat-associated protein